MLWKFEIIKSAALLLDVFLYKTLNNSFENLTAMGNFNAQKRLDLCKNE